MVIFCKQLTFNFVITFFFSHHVVSGQGVHASKDAGSTWELKAIWNSRGRFLWTQRMRRWLDKIHTLDTPSAA